MHKEVIKVPQRVQVGNELKYFKIEPVFGERTEQQTILFLSVLVFLPRFLSGRALGSTDQLIFVISQDPHSRLAGSPRVL